MAFQILSALFAFVINVEAQLINGPRMNAGSLPQDLKVKLEGGEVDLKKTSGLLKLKELAQQNAEKLNPEEDRKDLMVLTELIRLIDISLSQEIARRDREEALLMVAEIADTYKNEGRSPLPRQIDIPFTVLFVGIDYLHNPFGVGEQGRANNLVESPARDKSKVDPVDSTFWKNPGDIASKDTFFGFGRTELRDFSKPCVYKEPKDSLGANAGFVVKCGKDEVKIKFGEESTEPFAVRIFNILGFNVEPIDYAEGVQVFYDRKYFQEFNDRKPPKIKISLAGIPVYKFPLFKFFNPLNFVKKLVLKDGTEISGTEIPQFLFKTYNEKSPDFSDSNFRSENESLVSTFVVTPANIQTKDKKLKSIGAWDYNRLEKSKRRELRGLGFLGAWLNWYDARWDNTRLKIRETNSGVELVHFINDTGSVLGNATNFLTSRSGTVDNFPWAFTEIHEQWERIYPDREVPLKKVRYLRFRDFKMAYDDNNPFRDMTEEDAKWMARRIAQITEKQLLDALVASGFSSAEVKLYLEKLISRRDQMLKDLRLTKEFSLLRTKPVSQKFNYDPAKDGLMRAGPRGEFAAPLRNHKVIRGSCESCESLYRLNFL